MKFTVEVEKVISQFEDAIPLYISAILFYFLLTLTGLIITSILGQKHLEKKATQVLFESQIIGAMALLFVFAVVNFRGASIHTLLLLPGLLVLSQKKLKVAIRIPHGKELAKTFATSIIFLLLILSFQFVKYDFFHPTQVKIWGDYSYYAALSKGFLISHQENSYLSLPFFDQAIGYRLYHFSDLELNSFLTILFPKISSLYLYAYVYIPVFILILLNGMLAVLRNASEKNWAIPTSYTLLLGVLLSVLFNYHIHKSLLPFSLFLLLFMSRVNLKNTLAIVLASAITNPISLSCLPVIFILKHEQWFRQPTSAKLQKIVFICALVALLPMCFLAYQNMHKSYALKTLSEFILFEKAEILYPLLASVYLILFIYQAQLRKYLSIIIILLFLFSLALLPYTNLIANYESWQLHQTVKNFVFILAWVIALKHIMLLATNESSKPIPRALMKYLPFVILFLSLQNFRYLYGYNRQFYYACNKSELKQTEQLLSTNECIGTYNLYPKETDRMAYFTQRAAFTYELYFTSFFSEKQVWLTNIHMHQRYDSLQDVLKKNWESSLYVNFQKAHTKKDDAVINFLRQYRIHHIISNCKSDSLPSVLQKKVIQQQQFYVDTTCYYLFKLKEH